MVFMLQQVLITGGVGFLGCHLARKLIQERYHVTLYDIAPLEAKDLIGKVIYVQGDIRDKKTLEKVIKNKQYLIHAAAALPIQRKKDVIFSVNVNGTKQVLDVSLKNKVKRLVFISTTAVYGVPKHLPETEESPLDPIGYYGQSKVEGEKLCLLYDTKGLEVNILRPKTFLGPERLGVFELWFEAIYNNRRIYILGNGTNLYQLLDVHDLNNAILKTMTTTIHGETFNIGAKQFKSWRKDLGYVIKHAGSKSVITSLPTTPSQYALSILEKLNLSPLSAWHYKTMPVPSYVSIRKAEKLLDWHPTVSNQQLLFESYQWYEKNRQFILHATGKTHRVGWNFKLLNLVTRF